MSSLHGKPLESPCTLCVAVAYCCGAVALLALLLPSLGVSSLDLGRFFIRSGPFFFQLSFLSALAFISMRAAKRVRADRIQHNRSKKTSRLFRCGLERAEIAERHRGRQHVGEHAEVRRNLRKARTALAPPLVHVDRSVELELHGVQATGRVAVMLGDEAAGIGLVTADRIAEPG